MSDKNQEQENIDDIPSNKVGVDKSKRKFSKVAGVAAPVIMAFASRPSWVQAADDQCSFRQALSGNTSPNGPNPECIETRASTVSPGIFRGDGGGAKWEDFGVGGLRTADASTIFSNDPIIELKAEFIGPDAEFPGPVGITTLEQAIKANKNDYENGTDFKTDKQYLNKILHYIAAYLMASSTSSPVEEDPQQRPLIYPYSPSQISNDWGIWDLYPILQSIQDIHFNVGEANVEVGITL